MGIKYPLVNSHITMENHHVYIMGKSTISMAIFNCKLLVYQRVEIVDLPIIKPCETISNLLKIVIVSRAKCQFT